MHGACCLVQCNYNNIYFADGERCNHEGLQLSFRHRSHNNYDAQGHNPSRTCILTDINACGNIEEFTHMWNPHG